MASAGSRQGSRNAATILEALGRRKQSEPLRRVQSVDQTTVPSLAMDRGGIARRISSGPVVLARCKAAFDEHACNPNWSGSAGKGYLSPSLV